MNSFRFFAPVAAAIAAVVVIGTGVSANAQSVGITIDGRAVDVSPAAIMQTGRVFVPLRGVFEQLGASVVYANGQIDAAGHGRDISLHVGSTEAAVDGTPETIDVAPFIVGESTYVPLRFISQALGAVVSWDDADSIVAISTSDQSSSYVAPPPGNEYGYGNDGYANDQYADVAPPPIPIYAPPPVPVPNDIWMPGYWSLANAGYYWVPGTWVAPPHPGYLWTPGYWAANGARFAFHAGYWALHVGFYGGIDYGAGYYGHGYVGGRWYGDTFHYNTAVTRVTNTTIIRNVYVDRTVIVNNVNVHNRISYVGGAHGVRATPTASERYVQTGPRIAMTPVQAQHVRIAAQDRRLLHSVNAGRPPVAAVARPLAPGRAAVHPAAAPAVEHAAYAHPHSAVPPTRYAAPVRPAEPPVHAYAPAAAPRPEGVRPQAARPAPVAHPQPPAHPAYVAPRAPAPMVHPQAVRPVNVQPPPERRPQMARPAPPPQVHPPVAHPAPPRAASQPERPHPNRQHEPHAEQGAPR